MTNREDEIAATYGIAAVESEGCVSYVLQTYWPEFNGGQVENMHSHQNNLYNCNIWYIIHCTKTLFLNQPTNLFVQKHFFSSK